MHLSPTNVFTCSIANLLFTSINKINIDISCFKKQIKTIQSTHDFCLNLNFIYFIFYKVLNKYQESF